MRPTSCAASGLRRSRSSLRRRAGEAGDGARHLAPQLELLARQSAGVASFPWARPNGSRFVPARFRQQHAHSRPVTDCRPRCRPASSPDPKNRSARAAPSMADPYPGRSSDAGTATVHRFAREFRHRSRTAGHRPRFRRSTAIDRKGESGTPAPPIGPSSISQRTAARRRIYRNGSCCIRARPASPGSWPWARIQLLRLASDISAAGICPSSTRILPIEL